MSDINDFLVELATTLNTTQAIDDVKELEKELRKNKIELNAVLNTSGNERIVQEWAIKIQEMFKGRGIDIDTTKIISSLHQVQRQVENVSNKVSKIKFSMDNGHGISEYQNRINKLINDFERYGVASDKAKNETKELENILKQMKNMSGDRLVAQADKLEQEFKAVKVSVEQAKLAYDKFSQPVSNEKATSLINRINTFLTKNTRITKEARVELQGFVQELGMGGTTLSRWNDINNTLKSTENSMRGLNRLGSSLKNQFSQAAQSFTQWVSVSSGIMLLVNQLRKIPQEVYKIDTSMTNLYKVTDESKSKYTQFLNSASDSAFELGRSISGLVEQTANWAKLGFGIDEAEKLSKTSSIYANVGEVDDSTAVSDIVTAMKSFNIEAEDSITIVDSLNKLGNEFATDSASLGEGLTKSASALSLAGNDIHKTLAMLTGGTEITQNASEMGNATKILSMRLRGMKGELQELGEEYENVESISKIQTQILNQTNGSVNIFDDVGNFRATYDIIADIAKVWDKISQTDQAALLETIAGKQRGNQIAALIQSFQSGQAQKAYEASKNSEGSAMQEQERWLDSMEAKTQQFEAAFQSMSKRVLDSGLAKSFIEFGTSGVSAFEGLTKILGTITTLSGNLNGIGGTFGAISGFLMNRNGSGERTVFQWQICTAPTLIRSHNNAM